MRRLGHYVFVRHRHNWGLLTRFSMVGGYRRGREPVRVWTAAAYRHRPARCRSPDRRHQPSTCAGTTCSRPSRSWWRTSGTSSSIAAGPSRAPARAPWRREYGPFLAVGLAAQALGLLVLTMLVHPHSPVSLPIGLLDGSSIARSRELWAQAMTIAIVTPVSFVGNKLWTFRAARGVPPRAPPAQTRQSS